MKKLLLLLITSSIVLLLTACGGSSNSTSVKDSTESPSDTNITENPSDTNSTDTPSTVTSISGTFIDSAVSGMTYTCSSGTTGVTNSSGSYTCSEGDTVTFHIGNTDLGPVSASTTAITPMTIYPSNTAAATNIAQLLQSLDTDNNPSNGISFNTTKVALLNNTTLDFTSSTFDTFLENIIGTIVSEEDALAHLNETLSSLGEATVLGFKPFNIGLIKEDSVIPFNSAIATSGKYTVVGTDNSYVYLYKKDSNDEMHFISKFQAENTSDNDSFGVAVAIDGEYIVVGAEYANSLSGVTEAGVSYLFKINTSDDTVSQIAKFSASDAETDDSFGSAVDIHDDYIVVGAYYKNETGAAYAFKIDKTAGTVSQIDKVLSVNNNDEDEFGYQVAIHGNYFVVGASEEDILDIREGAAYVYEINSNASSVSQIAKLTSETPVKSDYFGGSVDIYGKYIVVGSSGDDNTSFENAGAAYVYKIDSINSSVSSVSVIQSNDTVANDGFGQSVSIFNNYIAINSSVSDKAYLFEIDSSDNISQIQELDFILNKGDSKSYSAIAISQETILVRDELDNDGVFVFSMEPTNRIYVHKEPSSSIQIKEESFYDIEEEFYIVSSEGNMSFTLSGNDAASFNISNSALSIKSAFDYENPTDIGSDNVYNITITAKSPNKETLTYTMTFNIQDRTFADVTKIQSNSVQENAKEGYSTSISGDFIVTGAPGEESVYVYKKDSDGSIRQIAKIEDSNTTAGDKFGYGVVIQDEYILVTAPFEDTNQSNAGSAYLYKLDTVNETVTKLQQLQADIPQDSSFFGISLAMKDDYVLIGASSSDTNVTKSGMVYMYELNTTSESLVQISTIQASNPGTDDLFGYFVALDTNYLVIGAHGQDSPAKNAGSAYVYKFDSSNNSVTPLEEIKSSDIASGDNFGSAVAINNNYITVGARYDGDYAGSAYLFKINDGDDSIVQIAKLESNDLTSSDYFGTPIAMDGDFVIVSATKQDTGGTNIGSVYVFKINTSDDTITQVEKIQSFDKEEYDYFGSSVAIENENLLIGSRLEDTGSVDKGSVYMYKLD